MKSQNMRANRPAAFSVRVNVEMDEEAGVWVATSDDVAGLIAEHADLQKLIDMTAELVPTILAENDALPVNIDCSKGVPVKIAVHGLLESKAPSHKK